MYIKDIVEDERGGLETPTKGRYVTRMSDIPEIESLSAPEKILLVQGIWDSIASDESSVPVPQSHLEEL